MIPERYVTEWSEQAPWVVNKFIEQDLIVCRALVSIYSDAFLAEHLAFRGGTALGSRSPDTRRTLTWCKCRQNPSKKR